MLSRWKEMLGVIVTVCGLLLVPWVVWSYEQGRSSQAAQPDARVVTLTGVSNPGVWTTQRIHGLNYWQSLDSKSARLKFREGERVYLRLISADVVHSFSIPQLQVGPFDIIPGKPVTVEIPTDQPGEYVYLCYTVCGKFHDNMKGWLVIHEAGATEDVGEGVDEIDESEEMIEEMEVIEDGEEIMIEDGEEMIIEDEEEIIIIEDDPAEQTEKAESHDPD